MPYRIKYRMHFREPFEYVMQSDGRALEVPLKDEADFIITDILKTEGVHPQNIQKVEIEDVL